jgi:protocatechuate 3,4-dioxygenase alpha subunit
VIDMLIYTPSQTMGPFYGSALIWEELTREAADGEPGAVEIRGTLADGEGPFVYPEGVVELWAGKQFTRAQTDDRGEYRVVLRRPRAVPPLDDGSEQAPHVNVTVFGRGLLKPLVTRMYFPDEPEANASDPVLGLVPADRRGRLVARPGEDGALVFDICVQGDHESVFFAI